LEFPCSLPFEEKEVDEYIPRKCITTYTIRMEKEIARCRGHKSNMNIYTISEKKEDVRLRRMYCIRVGLCSDSSQLAPSIPNPPVLSG
jgi:hypothetical protein